MKVLVLGGTGSMGAHGANLLLQYPDVEVTLGVRSKDKAYEMIAKLNMDIDRVQVSEINLVEKEALVALLKKHDVVLNAIGPFVKYGKYILELAIEARVNYVDICDDYDVTLELLSLDEKAKNAGISALICMGTTPGIANIQAKYAAQYFDEIENMKICWAITTPPLEKVEGTGTFNTEAYKIEPKNAIPKAAWEHMVHVGKGKVPVLINGKVDYEPALERCEYVDFAEPLGRVEAFVIGHSESITLPRTFDIKNYCACLGALMPEVMKALRKECQGREEPLKQSVYPDTKIWEAPDFWKEKCVWGGQAAIVEGLRNGKKYRCTIRFMMTTDFNQAVVYNNAGQAIGCHLMGNKKIKKRGVITPEECIDVADFLNEIVYCFNQLNDDEYTVENVMPIEYEELI